MKNKNELFINIAKLVSEQSTCIRLKVGAVLVKDDRIISIGYNGVPKGHTHCEDTWKLWYENSCIKGSYIRLNDAFKTFDDYINSKQFYNDHGEFSDKNELHAEQNALMFAAKNGISTNGSTLYVTLSPCTYCAKIIIAAGIKEVYYKDLYDRNQDGLILLKQSGISCIKYIKE